MERKHLSKKIRFQVLKRDNFTCQYCGRKAPDIALEVDHIHPVARGGDDDINNLITSCWECNIGKGIVSMELGKRVAVSEECRAIIGAMSESVRELISAEALSVGVDLITSKNLPCLIYMLGHLDGFLDKRPDKRFFFDADEEE